MSLRSLVLGVALSLAASVAMAADPTYTSQIGTALGEVDVTAIITDIGAFLGVIFGLVLVSVGYNFVSNRLRHSVK